MAGGKIFPGLKDGSRIIIAAKDETGRLAGTILLKKTAEEKKICCLFVRQDCRGRGIAGKLMQESLEVLQTDKPLLSIAEKNYPQMQKLLSLHHFKFSYCKNGAYTTNGTEYYFNNEATEILKKKFYRRYWREHGNDTNLCGRRTGKQQPISRKLSGLYGNSGIRELLWESDDENTDDENYKSSHSTIWSSNSSSDTSVSLTTRPFIVVLTGDGAFSNNSR